eukprot:CAMPEP_0172670420 /NCGR_PEP_ID=MMETSP1074-20121228/10289_1 /TAXON_ID=2916 /ORGANISM="Ceratium fusus, Strain PA161109" /LENGTH=672 /DNA_ID=CAMNT_0013487333 /DNA_START=55 /DNA_END=2073 /DNA_ORIENTATION=-
MFGVAFKASSVLSTAAVLSLLGVAGAQQTGTNKREEQPAITVATCTKSGGCRTEMKSVTMDAQWRWLHDARPNKFKNCISGSPPEWDSGVCSGAAGCAEGCALEGISATDYKHVYGVSEVPDGISLRFRTGEAVGSRVYVMEDENTYKMFTLLNKEFSIDVEGADLVCGMNGAIYLVEMEANGGMGTNGNAAGASLGTGYCDAQCPHDLKFINGLANLEGWHEVKTGPVGKHGACCAEMDIWEANTKATALTTHACDEPGLLRCTGEGSNQCGDVKGDCDCCLEKWCSCCGRYEGNCDKDGCDFNPFRLGAEEFYGKGSGFTVDASKKVTIVTQFLTSDGTDTGDLVEIRRLYVQDGKVIKNAQTTNLGKSFDSITDEMCQAQTKGFGMPHDDFTKKGGLKGMGKALGRGMVLVLSLWDDLATKMHWLDSVSPENNPDWPHDKPGVKRGPCPASGGNPHELRSMHGTATVTYSNIKVGEIDSTYGDSAIPAPAPFPRPPQPRPPQPRPPQPRPSQGPASGTGDVGAECCTASMPGHHPCEMCYPGAALSGDHWCAESKDHCGQCGGIWCPNGAKKVGGDITRFFEDQKGLSGKMPATHSFSIHSLAGVGAVALLSGFLAAAFWFRRSNRVRSSEGYDYLKRSEETSPTSSMRSNDTQPTGLTRTRSGARAPV